MSVEKPVLAAWTSYSPTPRSAIRKRPWLSLVTDCAAPVPTFRISTTASGRTAPDISLTVPRTVAVVPWPDRLLVSHKHAVSTQKNVRCFVIVCRMGVCLFTKLNNQVTEHRGRDTAECGECFDTRRRLPEDPAVRAGRRARRGAGCQTYPSKPCPTILGWGDQRVNDYFG